MYHFVRSSFTPLQQLQYLPAYDLPIISDCRVLHRSHVVRITTPRGWVA